MTQVMPNKKTVLDRIQGPALVVGVVALAVCLIVGFVPSQREAFFRGYLYGWLFWLGVSLGGLALSSLHNLTGGDWGQLTRRIASSAAMLLPLNALLFIPILFGLHYLFPWARAELVASDPVLKHRAVYMNGPFFTLRFLVYFVAWSAVAYGSIHTSMNFDRTKDPKVYDRLRKISALALVLYIALMTLAAVDWIMSREPHWTSSIFGFIICVDQTLTGLLFVVLILSQLIHRPEFAKYARPDVYNDLGNLLLMLTILWAYMNFAQFLITWTGNEQEDIGWYVQRTSGGWKTVAGLLIFLHFFTPFLMLLWRDMKRSLPMLVKFCVFLLLMRLVDLYWLLSPSSHVDPVNNDYHQALASPVLDLFALIGIGGIYLAAYVYVLHSRPLVPEEAPEDIDEDETLTHGHPAPQPG